MSRGDIGIFSAGGVEKLNPRDSPTSEFSRYNQDIRLDPSLPLSDSFQARLAAQAILRNHFDMKKAVAELRPDIKQWRAFGQRLLAEPAVRQKMEIIMQRGDKNAQKFLDTLWEWLERLDASMKTDGVVPTRTEMEAGLTAARILAKGYIREKAPTDVPSMPYVIEGLTHKGLSNLTGKSLADDIRKTNLGREAAPDFRGKGPDRATVTSGAST